VSEDSTVPRERRRLRRRRTEPSAVTQADPGAWRAAGIVAGVAAVLVLVGLLVPVPSAQDEAAGAVEPVDSSIAVCPEPGSTFGSRTTSAITVIPDLPGQDRPGDATIGYLDGAGSIDGDADEPGEADGEVQGGITAPGDTAQVVGQADRLPPLAVRTFGGLAPGLVAAQVTQDSFTRGRGLSSQPCLAPDTTWWFVGGGSTAGRESELVLVNPEDTPADLEVAISGPEGQVSAPRLRGVVVEPRGRVVLRLAEEAPGLPAVAWQVNVRQGRVVAALYDREANGFVPRGADWIPASADPATRVLIPGVSGGAGNRQLLVHAPGELTATVRVRLITAAGSFVPDAAPEIEVPGGTVVAVDLDEALQGDEATVDLQSDVPIVAGVRQRHPGVDASAGALDELSFTAGASPITSLSAVTGLPGERSTAVTVWLTAPDDVITIEPMSDDMSEPMSDDMSEPMSDDMSEPMSDDMSEPMSDDMSEPMSDDMSEPMSDDMSEPMSDDTSGDGTAPVDPGADEAASPPATVTLRILAVSLEGTPLPSVADITVAVPRGRLVAVDIPRPEGAAWYTAIASVTGGEVVIAHRAVRRNKDGSLYTGYPWRPLRTTVVVPEAVPDSRLATTGS
jgi:hypothetical protein